MKLILGGRARRFAPRPPPWWLTPGAERRGPEVICEIGMS